MIYIVGFFWVMFWGFLSYVCFSDGKFIYGLYLLLICTGPIILVNQYKKKKRARFAAMHARMIAALNIAPGDGFDYTERDTGIAICKSARALTLRIGEKWKTYPFSDIRAWETILERPGRVVGTSAGGALAAAQANDLAEDAASAASGLFVTVRDIDNPKWRIAMSDPDVQARWMEILRQCVNES